MSAPVRETVLADCAEHVLTISHDAGHYKHLWFGTPGTGMYGFNIYTAPGMLTVHGDMGTYVFARELDMISWFIGSSWQGEPNVDYWAQKCQAPDGRRGLKEYSQRVLLQRIEAALQDEVQAESLDEAEEAELRSAAEDFLSGYDLSNPHAYGELGDFTSGRCEPFSESWEWEPYEYTYQYQWTAHALLLALQAYRKQAAPACVRPQPDVSALVSAWNVPGPSPEYHRYAQQQLSQQWPTLHRAIETIISTTKEPTK